MPIPSEFLMRSPFAFLLLLLSVSPLLLAPSCGAPLISISAEPEVILQGESSTLIWDSLNAESLSIDNGIGAVDPSGSMTITPDRTTIYTITAANNKGSSVAQAMVTVNLPEVTASLNVEPSSILAGSSATLSWQTEHANSVSIDPGIGPVDANGSMTVFPTETTTYTLTATGPGGTSTSSTTLAITCLEPTVTLSASPASVMIGSSATLTWQSMNGDTATLDQGIGPVPVQGSITVSPPETTTYTVTVTGPGGTATASAEVRVVYPTPTVSISAEPATILAGEFATLSWQSTHGQQVVIDNGIGSVGTSGSITVSPTQTMTYTIMASGLGGTATDTATVTVVHPEPTASIALSPDEISPGEFATLSWHTEHAHSVSISPGIGSVQPFGSMTVSPEQSTTFIVTATGHGTATASASLIVTMPQPLVTLSAIPATIKRGESSTLSWQSFNGSNASIDQGIGTVPLTGTMTVSPELTTTYAITVTGPSGNATDTARVHVTADVEPQPEGSFGEQYQDLIPADATAEYDPGRFIVLTGFVHSEAGQPLDGVLVSIHGHPGYGSVRTDMEGRFSIPAEGGSVVRVQYEKEGYITSHRQVHTGWNNIVVVETLALITRDPLATKIVFDGNANSVISHTSSIVSDESGSRSLTMVFSGDNRAYELDAQGNVVRELTAITARATEFATQKSMPGVLPPNVAYTYCVEMEADGIERIRFAKPMVSFVDNFLGFAVGSAVPVGSYDRDRGVWVPEKNGMVVRLLDLSGDGLVDALDATGDGLPDDLNGNGQYSDEVRGLDPQRFSPKQTLWRFEAGHFTPWDCNWPYGPPQDATDPNAESDPDVDQQKDENKDCRTATNSFVEDRSRIFHENIPIPGTDMSLHYASNRVQGYRTKITVPASGATVPASLKNIIVKVEIAGRILEADLPPLPSKTEEFIWDGLDQLGRPVIGSTVARISIGFVYDAIYYSPGNFPQAFGQPGSVVTGILARQEAISWKRFDKNIANLRYSCGDGKGMIAEGWSLSHHHILSPIAPGVLHKGDGIFLDNKSGIIETVAGSSDLGGYDGDGEPAISASLNWPRGLAVDAAGNIFIADFPNKVRKVDAEGILMTVAGTGTPGFGGDGGSALDALLDGAIDVAVAVDGSIYIAENHNHRVRKVDANGIITTVAGTGTPGYSGDGGLSVAAGLNDPTAVAVDGVGNLYIADAGNQRVRKVANGIVTTIAGNGREGKSGDGGPATEARLNFPGGLAVDDGGNLFIADTYNHVIRKVDSAGVITTVAGNGREGYAGDGGPALEARLAAPFGITLDGAGNLFIADCFNNRIRKVDTHGIITTIAGTGDQGFGGDGGIALAAQLSCPVDVAVNARGDLFVSDLDNCRIRKIASPSAFRSLISAGDIPFAEENGLGHIFSSAGLHKKTIDLDTGITLRTFGYDAENRLNTITDQFGNVITIDREGSGVPYSIVSPDCLTTHLSIKANGHLVSLSFPDGSSHVFEYTPDGLMTAKIDPNGNRFEQVFDAAGRLNDILDPEGGHWRFSRSESEPGEIIVQKTTGEGDVTTYREHSFSGVEKGSVTGPSGGVSTFTDHAEGLTETMSLSCGTDLALRYGLDPEYTFKFLKEKVESTPAGLSRVTVRDKTYQDTNGDDIPDMITETVTVNNKTTTLSTNTQQANKTVTSPTGRQVAMQYDAGTLVTTRLTIPGLEDVTYGYNSQGRLSSVNQGSRQSNFAYDGMGFLRSVTDPENRTATYDHDPLGRVTGIRRPDNSRISFVYDAKGNMTVLTNPATVPHGFAYNGVDKQTAYYMPLSGSYQYHYDRDRRLTEILFPSGRQISNRYSNGRLIQTQTPEGNIDYTYLCATTLGSMTWGSESIDYDYDGTLLISETRIGILQASLRYFYDNDFRLSSFNYAGTIESYAYDPDGLLTGSGDYTISRNAGNGLPESVTGNGLTISRTFTGYGEISGQSTSRAETIGSWSVTRDKAGKIIAKNETVSGQASSSVYAYDNAGRLASVTRDGVLVEEYAYNPNGSRIYERNVFRGITGRSLSYSEEDHLLTAGDVTYQYDLDGFLFTRTEGDDVTSYQYSSRGELLKVILPDGLVIEYDHDPLGRRIAKKVEGEITEKYLWQGMTRLLAVYDGSSNLLMRFEYADERMPVSMTRGGSRYFLAYDQVGSLNAVADSNGFVIKKIEYDSFGNLISDSDPGFEVPLGFAGGLHDRDTSLVRFGYRDYDPETGRWTAKDPIGFAGGDTDLYGYVLNIFYGYF
jgi:RHS repeat-associated protein